MQKGEERQWITIDILGGDGTPETETKDYEGDASARNLEALGQFIVEEYAQLTGGRVGFVIVGRSNEIEECLEKASEKLPSKDKKDLDFIQTVDAKKQTPMGSKKPEKESSMTKMFEFAKNNSTVAVYTAGSTASEVTGSLSFREKPNRPFISKEIVPGVYFGDNGAITNPKLEDYSSMLKALEHQDEESKRSIMVLPSDHFELGQIQNQIAETHVGRNLVEFDPLAEIGIKKGKPSQVLADGFIGNLHLKIMEVLYKEKTKDKELKKKKERDAIKKRVVSLEGNVKNGWEIPGGIEAGKTYSILCNGTEETKGTPEIKNLVKKISEAGATPKLVEPSELVSGCVEAIFATPASKNLVDAFFAESLRSVGIRNPFKALALRRTRKGSTAMAEILNLKPETRVFAAHGNAPKEETLKNLKELFKIFNR